MDMPKGAFEQLKMQWWSFILHEKITENWDKYINIFTNAHNQLTSTAIDSQVHTISSILAKCIREMMISAGAKQIDLREKPKLYKQKLN